MIFLSRCAIRTILCAGAIAALVTLSVAQLNSGRHKQMHALVADSAAQAVPLAIGMTPDDSVLLGQDGRPIHFYRLIHQKKTVLIFYRGDWCPFCNAHLADLARIEGELRHKGYQIIAVSPDAPAELTKTLTRNHLTYQLFSDSKADAMKNFGVAYRLDDATFNMYRDNYHVDLERYSGQPHHILPVPSVFIMNQRGVILYVHSDPDYKVRLKGSELLKAIKESKT